MAERDVERWRREIEDFRAASSGHDWERWLASSGDFLDPNIEWDATEVPVPGISGVYRGRDAVANWWREWLSAWETVEFDYELVDAGEQVVLLLDQRMRGRATGIEVPLGRYAHVGRFENGRLTHWKFYASQGRALRAVGLDPASSS